MFDLVDWCVVAALFSSKRDESPWLCMLDRGVVGLQGRWGVGWIMCCRA